jgi:murein DD-endopeptidase MepM/ murein hydrolase activator NlpD
MRSRSLRLGLAVIATLLLALPAAAAGIPIEEDESASGVGATPVVANLVPQRQIVPVRGSDGRWHAMYELLLTNSTAKPATLGSVSVLDPDSGRRVLSITAEQLVAEDLKMLDRNPVKNATLPAEGSRALFISVSFGSQQAIPARLTARFQLTAFNPFTLKNEKFAYRAGAVTISRLQPPVLVPPLRGGSWLASDGCCTASGHVSALYGLAGNLQAAERYAIDWIEIGPDGRIFHGDPAVLGNWYGYGQPVLSTAAGVVTEAKDGLPDQTPLVKPGTLTLGDLPGNVVVVRIKGGFSAVYAHLVPGSLKVKVGDRVKVGQELGKLGNSGGSLAPHLHFHVVDGPSASTSDGYPYVLDTFQLAAGSDVGALAAALQGKAGFPTAEQLRLVPHHGELPLGFTIDQFGVD